MTWAKLGLAACLALGIQGIASAQDMKIAKDVLAFALDGYTNGTLTISGPNDFQARAFSEKGEISVSLDGLEDGVYTYELSFATDKMQAIRNPLDNGRGDAERREVNVGMTVSGTFAVIRGSIVEPKPGASDRDEG